MIGRRPPRPEAAPARRGAPRAAPAVPDLPRARVGRLPKLRAHRARWTPRPAGRAAGVTVPGADVVDTGAGCAAGVNGIGDASTAAGVASADVDAAAGARAGAPARRGRPGPTSRRRARRRTRTPERADVGADPGPAVERAPVGSQSPRARDAGGSRGWASACSLPDPEPDPPKAIERAARGRGAPIRGTARAAACPRPANGTRARAGRAIDRRARPDGPRGPAAPGPCAYRPVLRRRAARARRRHRTRGPTALPIASPDASDRAADGPTPCRPTTEHRP